MVQRKDTQDWLRRPQDVLYSGLENGNMSWATGTSRDWAVGDLMHPP